jgi:hypothetical protein
MSDRNSLNLFYRALVDCRETAETMLGIHYNFEMMRIGELILTIAGRAGVEFTVAARELAMPMLKQGNIIPAILVIAAMIEITASLQSETGEALHS